MNNGCNLKKDSEENWLDFKSQWENNWFYKQSEITDDIQKYAWSQMNMFFSGVLLIYQIICIDGKGCLISHEKLHTDLTFRQISIPILRLIMESYFRMMYLCLCENQSTQIERFEKILSTIAKEYNKFIEEIKGHPEYFDSAIKGLPPSAKVVSKPISIKYILKNISTTDGNDFSFMYGLYLLTSFYAHGNIDKVTWEIIFDKKDISYTLPLDIFKVISIISKFYLHIAHSIWGDCKESIKR